MINRHYLLGVPVSAVNMEQTISTISGWIEQRDRQFVCVTPAHSIMDCREDPDLSAIFNRSGLSTPDGMAVVWLLKLLGYKHVTRVYGPDLLLALCNAGLLYGWKHYFYGGQPHVLEKLVAFLRSRYPSMEIAGFQSPPFRQLTDEEDAEIIDAINQAQPEIIWVGLGAPKQERWMNSHRPKLHAPVLIGVGAAFDFLSAEKPQAPKWLRSSGFEWLFRLLSEPVRLWPRYRRYPQFVVLALAQLLGLSSFSSSKKGPG